VEVTLQLIAAHGVEGTSTKRIAAAAGVSEATLYKHFTSRNEILLAALDAVYDRVFEIIHSSRESDALTRLREIGRFELSYLTSHGEQFTVPLFEFIAAPPEAGLREPLGRKQLAAVEAHAAIVEEGKAQGVIRNDVDSQRVAWELVSIYWLRDVAYLMGLGDVVYKLSSSSFDEILARISV
jgi:AcrR family transcriptional regulator